MNKNINLKSAKKILLFLVCIILFPLLGCKSGIFWFSGGNIFWEPINYFPLAVDTVLMMEPFGKEFWVKSDDNDIYHIVYPCKNKQSCWEKVDTVPEVDISRVVYKVTEDACINNLIRYSLFSKIRSCITSTVPDQLPWIVSLALTEDNRLWIWQRPWDSPYNILFRMFLWIIITTITGLLIGLYLVSKIR